MFSSSDESSGKVSRISSNLSDSNVRKSSKKRAELEQKVSMLGIERIKELEITQKLEQQKTFYENIIETDNETSDDEAENSFLKQEPLVIVQDFIEAFQPLPDIEDISEDISIEPKVSDDLKDEGNVVDRLVDDEVYSAEEEECEEEEEEEIVKENDDIVEKDLMISDVYIDYEFDFPQDSFDEKKKAQKTVIEEEEANLEEFLIAKVDISPSEKEDVDWEAIARMEAMLRSKEEAEIVLSDLIRKVVDTVEYVSPEKYLRLKLDKRALMNELFKNVTTAKCERYITSFLENRIKDHFKRKRKIGPFLPERRSSMEKTRYENTLKRLDINLERERLQIESTDKLQQQAEEELSEATQKAKAEVEALEEMFRQSLKRDDRPRLNSFVEKMIREMALCRKDISEVRFQYIIQIHKKATLVYKMNQVEDLGDNMKMKDYSALANQAYVLTKKIEERNNELSTFFFRVRHDINTIAHYKEKQTMLQNYISAQRLALDELLEESLKRRKKIHAMKLKRGRIRNEIKFLSFREGLLDKPLLLHDYDDTCRILNRKRATINYLKNVIEEKKERLQSVLSLGSSASMMSFIFNQD